jgi:hypothetical protein
MSKLSKFLKKVEKSISNVIPHQHSADRRLANQAAAEQINFYQQTKKEMEEEKTRVEQEKNQERDKIQQKQIKSMRRSYRAPGFMDEVSDGLGDTLG